MSDHIIQSQQDGVLRIQFNRPEKRNALTVAMYGAVADAIASAREDGDVRALYVTGTAGCFTAGNDLMDFMNPTDGLVQVSRFLREIAAVEKPLVAGVSGMAIGIGVTMLLHCDLAYAARSATFKTPFVDLGLAPEAGSSLIMPQSMGHQRAAELLLLGEKLDAEKARDYGLVNAVVADGDLEETALGVAIRLAERAPGSLRASKALLKRAQRKSVEATMAVEGEVFLERLKSPELTEAIQAFMQRRTPDFSKFS